ncbi:hypothetical protein HMPREF3189_01461 [Clostridiales bacterium KA00134]|nr:hypothetical protein HMPREF3189_01461 [Clostridiales bacterium KA00134]
MERQTTVNLIRKRKDFVLSYNFKEIYSLYHILSLHFKTNYSS